MMGLFPYRLFVSMVLAVYLLLSAPAWAQVDQLPPLPALADDPSRPDWLIHPVDHPAGVYRTDHPREIALDNGLVRRTFRLEPNAATVGLDNTMTGEALLRAVKPEARLTIDGNTFDIGGLSGQPDRAYLRAEWLDGMTADPAAFQLTGFEVGPAEAPFEWRRVRHASAEVWPPPGASLRLDFTGPPGPPGAPGAPGEYSSLRVSVHYEIYRGLPLLAKWFTLTNGSERAIELDAFDNEILAVVEAESSVEPRRPGDWRLPLIHAQSSYAFRGMDTRSSNQTIHWLADPDFESQVNYQRQTPSMLVSRPPIGPGARLAPGETFTSYRTYLLVHDSSERERQGLAVRRMHRVIAPWATENPLMMHVRRGDSETFRRAVDQCAEVGFEMIIYTFGSGLNMESDDPDYIARIKADVDYAHERGIEVGGYSLLASRKISDEDDAINPETGKPGGAIFGNSPCLGSQWGQAYFEKLRHFIEATGMDLLEHDGNYPGDVCASIDHPGHRGLADSQWTQWKTITNFYKWCRERGTYLNVPDYYFLAGSNKVGMGYRETNWSLPRERQVIHGRQNIYDGTWEKTPSMGWMFVPLVEYHGGGEAATLEPLSEHLDAYEAHLINNLAAGVQACYRGPRLYDTDATKALLKKWVDWFKEYRDILESDIIHLSRPDGRGLDAMLHVNPDNERRGMAIVFNPTDRAIKETLRLPLYYTGIAHKALISEGEGEPTSHQLARDYSVRLSVEIPPHGFKWFLIAADER